MMTAQDIGSVPVLWVYGNAHGPVEPGGDDVVEDIVGDEARDSDPVVQRVGPVDAA